MANMDTCVFNMLDFRGVNPKKSTIVSKTSVILVFQRAEKEFQKTGLISMKDY